MSPRRPFRTWRNGTELGREARSRRSRGRLGLTDGESLGGFAGGLEPDLSDLENIGNGGSSSASQRRGGSVGAVGRRGAGRRLPGDITPGVGVQSAEILHLVDPRSSSLGLAGGREPSTHMCGRRRRRRSCSSRRRCRRSCNAGPRVGELSVPADDRGAGEADGRRARVDRGGGAAGPLPGSAFEVAVPDGQTARCPSQLLSAQDSARTSRSQSQFLSTC